MPSFKAKMKPRGRSLLIMAWLSYALAYLLRVNMAVVLPDLVREEGYRYSQVGGLASLFFVTYLSGQLIHGYLGDHIAGKILITSGLFISALCNLAMSTGQSFIFLLVVWGINGFAQSMLWAPLMKMLADFFPARRLDRISFIMAQSVIFGYAVSWGSASLIRHFFDWTAVFRWPAYVVLVYVIILLFFFPSQPDTCSDQPEDINKNSEKSPHSEPVSLRVYFTKVRMLSLLIIALCQGLIREGIGVWFPTVVQDMGGRLSELAWIILMIVPLVHFLGVLFVRQVHRKCQSDSLLTLPVLFVPVALITLILFWNQPAGMTLMLMALSLALTHGMTPLLTSVIPFQHKRFRRVSLATGLLDFAIYCGAALSSLIGGVIAERHGLDRLTLLWFAAAILGLAVAVYRLNRMQRNRP